MSDEPTTNMGETATGLLQYAADVLGEAETALENGDISDAEDLIDCAEKAQKDAEKLLAEKKNLL